jgi:hypothetical protein
MNDSTFPENGGGWSLVTALPVVPPVTIRSLLGGLVLTMADPPPLYPRRRVRPVTADDRRRFAAFGSTDEAGVLSGMVVQVDHRDVFAVTREHDPITKGRLVLVVYVRPSAYERAIRISALMAAKRARELEAIAASLPNHQQNGGRAQTGGGRG